MERVSVVKTFNGSNPILRDRGVRVQAGTDSEISVFDAKKYFKETSDQKVMVRNRVSSIQINLDRISQQCHLGDGIGKSYRSRSFQATPTTSSEASWNSHMGLLKNPPGAIAVSLSNNGSADRQKKIGSAARWLFGRKCPCSGRKAVQVQDKASPESKTPGRRLSFNQTSKFVLTRNSHLPRSKSVPEKSKSEKSLENPEEITPLSRPIQKKLSPAKHFRSELDTGFTFPILDQLGPPKMALPTLVDPPRDSVESLEVYLPVDPRVAERDSKSFTSRIQAAEDDMASDASSDLFEIESFSARRDEDARRIGGSLYCRRSLDEAMTPSAEGYEPSERSIEWSVTTATNAPSESGEGRKKRSGNGLLGCRWEKAVSVVGPQPQAVVGTRHVGGRPPIPMGRSKSARLSLPFAT